MALAALTLGLIGMLFPLGVIFFFILFTRSGDAGANCGFSPAR